MFNKKPLADTATRRPSTGAQAKIYSRDNVARYSERARQRRRSHTIRHVALIVVLGVLLSAYRCRPVVCHHYGQARRF